MPENTVSPATIYSIGHSTHPIEHFQALLRGAGIEAVLDVRSVPQSRFSPQFGRARLEAALAAGGIGYVFLGDALGGKPRDPAVRRDGAVDYELVAATATFAAGLDRVAREGARRRVALMCAEKAPMDCHRALLIAPRLVARGHAVIHVLADGAQLPHASIEDELLRRYAPADDLLTAGDGRDTRLGLAYRSHARRMTGSGARR
ncbi:MAG: DUF488 domain-containing protein [Alphaproteobacteria bacterium]|nr:DUF488 domain-containing protein [Alphaproteobacteria bacterium]